ncbi:DeoR family transcriptional regulator [Mycobacterium vulneris]|uniref:Lactose phosphotransferase system repressor n=1 Tax=Mycolicibacterium porcinum TaxID=39693 RepID=A0ABV3V8B4_9MYCO|nr:DeoR/GlpR family DNA-binding transcription regulator [Mycolicibacterium porcinum]MBX8686783.1 DeoR family transcriptional regulator [Mycobacterium sp. 20091114027_K0903767]OCB47141.1 DeoR family transcriptional regulator [Mycolicibacterium vulneris]OCB07993.1 DeoR family transcriptional regulator [Mycolicibacterium porcinum]OCB55175.1 DeoR family transcriptional regulator [Mycolicibacterium vulneris]OCB66657.1 DeoR family transcriptional regulator [Mycolicibacterium vulneris]
MLPVERHEAIVEAVGTAQAVSTDELVRRLGVSAETVRRDLAFLEERGALRRVHGGAAAVADHRPIEPSYSERTMIRHQAKAQLARVAAGLLENGQTVIIDIGTTAVAVAQAIPRAFTGTVITPSLPVAVELADRPGIEVLLAGGRVRAGDLACSNAHTKAFFTDVYADIALLGSGGVDAAAGLTDFHLDEIDVRRTIIANSARSYILADSSKLGQVAPYRVCDLSAVNGLITDQNTDPAVAAALEETGGVVMPARPASA